MPFEFNGQPPAFGGQPTSTPTGFASFASSSAGTFSARSSPWAATPPPQTSSMSNAMKSGTTGFPFAATSALEPHEHFSEALLRASSDNATMSSFKDKAADAMMGDLLKNSPIASTGPAKILEEMRQCPALAAMTRSLFDKVLAIKGKVDKFGARGSSSSHDAKAKDDVMSIFKDRTKHKPRRGYGLDPPFTVRPNTTSEFASFEPPTRKLTAKPPTKKLLTPSMVFCGVESEDDEFDEKDTTTVPKDHASQIDEAEKQAQVSAAKTTSTQTTKAFRFMDLPPELRLVVYREHLVHESGYISILAYPLGKIHKNTRSGVDTQVLRVSKQIYHEAKDIIYKENKIMISADVHPSNHTIIPQYVMSDNALSKIVSLVLLCDITTSAVNHNPAKQIDYEKSMIWRRFQHLTALKSLRIMVLERRNQKKEISQREDMLAQLLQRIPSDCTLTYGSKEEDEKEFVKLAQEETDEAERLKYYSYAESYEVAEDDVRKAAETAMDKVAKGCKSGHEEDYRFPKRAMTLAPLGGGDRKTLDPRFVFGASRI